MSNIEIYQIIGTLSAQLLVGIVWFKIGQRSQRNTTVKWATKYLQGMAKGMTDKMVERALDGLGTKKNVDEKKSIEKTRERQIDGAVTMGELRVLKKLVDEI